MPEVTKMNKTTTPSVVVGDHYSIMMHKCWRFQEFSREGTSGNIRGDLPKEGTLIRERYTYRLNREKKQVGGWWSPELLAAGHLAQPERFGKVLGGKWGIGEPSGKADWRARAQR